MQNKSCFVKIFICAAFVLLFAATMFFSQTSKISAVQTSENDTSNPQNCAACHQQNYNSWHRDSHSQTVKKATAETVRGDFERNNYLDYNGVKTEMTRDDENFYIKIGDANYKVVAVVGVKYIEQYVAEKDGAFYSLPVAYNLAEKRWIHLNDTNFERKDGDFSRHLQNWKTDCADCHRSGENDFVKGFDDFGISCGACHGDAAEHVKSKTSLWAQIGFKTENKIINPQNLSSDASMMVCAQCHARDSQETPEFGKVTNKKHSDNVVSAHQQNDETSDKFWADGANKFSGNEYQAIIRSVCYVQSKSGGHGIAGEKINCASCHSIHEPDGENNITEKSYNQNCIQCHSQFSDDAAIAEHTKHSLNSEASNCVSCHQPETVYSRMRFNRTHEISVPNPVLTVENQIPNACNLCHTDKSVNWAITSSKKFWSEHFRDAEISKDRQFNLPEGVRGLSSSDPFLRALAADSLRKHRNPNCAASSLLEASQTEKFPLVKYFFLSAFGSDESDFPKNSHPVNSSSTAKNFCEADK